VTNAIRVWFIVAYGLGFVFFLALVHRFRARRQVVERRAGLLPPPPALVSWLIPPIIIFTEVGQIAAGWLPLRLLGVGLSLYALVIMPWAAQVLGRFYMPGPAVLKEHGLVTSGPFRFVRHPIYSAVGALWLGAAVGTLNWILLLLFPGIVAAVSKFARVEEEMLRTKFDGAYDTYAQGKGLLVPRF
jgi:protein-S-isoprenylcysteine O-methyltransferase Ste14